MKFFWIKVYLIQLNLNLDPCDISPCQDGFCERDGYGEKTCINPCDNNPCNNGTCEKVDKANYNCTCGAYSGLNCEIGM